MTMQVYLIFKIDVFFGRNHKRQYSKNKLNFDKI